MATKARSVRSLRTLSFCTVTAQLKVQLNSRINLPQLTTEHYFDFLKPRLRIRFKTQRQDRGDHSGDHRSRSTNVQRLRQWLREQRGRLRLQRHRRDTACSSVFSTIKTCHASRASAQISERLFHFELARKNPHPMSQ